MNMPQNLFAACRAGDGLIAKRVRLNAEVQEDVEDIFADQERQFRAGIDNEIDFDGRWKPEDNEVLTVHIPSEGQVFIETITANAVSVPELSTTRFNDEGIKALFTGTVQGGKTKVLIQQFSSRQLLSRKFSLLQHENAFRRLTDPAFTLDTSLTCVAEEGKLKFKSFHKMRAIVDLMDVYRAATDTEVQTFLEHPSFGVEDIAAFKEIADQVTRKLIHAIGCSGVLDNYGPNEIEAAARTVRIPITVRDDRIVLPRSRAEIKRLLRFLDDGLYQAPLSGQCYVTNSKRPA